MSGRRGGTVFGFLLAIYVAISVGKIQDALPFVAALRPAKIVAAVLILSAFFTLSSAEVRAFFSTRPAKWVAFIVVLSIVGVPFSLWPGFSFGFLLNDYSRTLVMFVIVAMGTAYADVRREVVTAFVLAVAFLAARVVVGHAPAEVGRSFIGSAFDPNGTAVLFLTTLPLIPVVVAGRRKAIRAIVYLAGFLLVAGIVRTGSRTGFLGLMLLAAWLTVTAPPRQRWIRVAVIVLGAGTFAATANENTWTRLSSVFAPTQDYNYTTRYGRVQIWKRGLKYMWDRPVLGIGVAAFPVAEGTVSMSGLRDEGYGVKHSVAHNALVEIGAELGIPGLVAFLALIWSASQMCFNRRGTGPRPRKVPRVAPEARPILGSLLLVLLGSMFLTWAFHPVMYFVLALCTGLGLERKRLKRVRPRPSSTVPISRSRFRNESRVPGRVLAPASGPAGRSAR